MFCFLESPDTLVNKHYKHSSTDINFEDHITGFLPPFILYKVIYDQLLSLGPHTFFFYQIIPPTIPWTHHDIWTKMHAPHLECHFISLNNSPIRSTSSISCFNNYKSIFQIYFGWWVGGQEKEKKKSREVTESLRHYFKIQYPHISKTNISLLKHISTHPGFSLYTGMNHCITKSEFPGKDPSM